MSDQPQPEPIELLRTKAKNLEWNMDSLRRKTSLSDVLDTVGRIDSRLTELPGAVTRLRARGYVFKSYLEADVAAAQTDWPSVRPRLLIEADQQRAMLTAKMDELQQRFTDARIAIDSDMARAEGELNAVEATMQGLDRSAGAVVSTLQGMYNTVQTRLNKIDADIRNVDGILNQVDQASFKLYPEENIIDTMEGQWLTDQKGGPKGVLFCTDHRLIFEQKEEIATKRVLFVVTEKKKVQQVAFEAPIGSVEQVKESESGALLFRKDHLELVFGAQSKIRSAHLILKGDSAEWQRLINRVNAGEIEHERVKAEGEQKAESKPMQIPSQCPACGARFTQEIVRGMNSVKCQFCGTVTPLQ